VNQQRIYVLTIMSQPRQHYQKNYTVITITAKIPNKTRTLTYTDD